MPCALFEEFEAKGYTVIININQNLSAEVLNNKKFKCLNIESVAK
jgi:hypothetical protein